MRDDYSEMIENLPYDPEVKVMVHCHFDEDADPHLNKIDTCFMTNWKSLKVRKGWGRFQSYYDVEYTYRGYHFIDTSRSFVRMLCAIREGNERTNWPGCDFVSQLVRDLTLTSYGSALSKANQMLLTTIFPIGLAEFMENSYLHRSLPERVHLNEPRVLNHPQFYQDKHRQIGNLVEIAIERGRLWALDRTKPIPTPEVLAEEIALLCYAIDKPSAIRSIQSHLVTSITTQMNHLRLSPSPDLS